MKWVILEYWQRWGKRVNGCSGLLVGVGSKVAAGIQQLQIVENARSGAGGIDGVHASWEKGVLEGAEGRDVQLGQRGVQTSVGERWWSKQSTMWHLAAGVD